MSGIEAVVSDFGGVLTTPLLDAFAASNREAGVPLDALGRALAALAARDGTHPLHELEKGALSEADFLAALQRELAADLGREVDLRDFGAIYFAQLAPNEAMLAHLASVRERGVRLALCTNNVREWEPRWRAMLPVDELFEVVVDSAFVGTRKPELEIYAVTLDRLGCPAAACLFVDDVQVNCEGARAAGMRTVHFRDSAQAIAEIDAALAS